MGVRLCGCAVVRLCGCVSAVMRIIAVMVRDLGPRRFFGIRTMSVLAICSAGVNHRIIRHERFYVVKLWQSSQQLERILAEGPVACIVLCLGENGEASMLVLRELVQRGHTLPPIIAECPHVPAAFSQLRTLLDFVRDVRVALQSLGAAATDVEIERLRTRGPTAREHILNALLPSLSQEMFGLLLPAITVGCEKSRPICFERAARSSSRALRHRLTQLQLPAPLKLLGLLVGCRVAFETELHGMNIATAAVVCGFLSSDELRMYLKSRTKLAPTERNTGRSYGSTQTCGMLFRMP